MRLRTRRTKPDEMSDHRRRPRSAAAVLASGRRRRVRHAAARSIASPRSLAITTAASSSRSRSAGTASATRSQAAQVRSVPRPVAAAERGHISCRARPARLADRRSRAPRVARRQGFDRPRPARTRRPGECRCRRRRCDPAAVLRSVHGLRLRVRPASAADAGLEAGRLWVERGGRGVQSAPLVRNMAGPFHFRGTAILGES